MTDFTIYADEDWTQPFQYNDASAHGINITGAAIVLVAISGANTITHSTAASTITINGDQVGSAGQFVVLFAAADTVSYGGAQFAYEIKMRLGGVTRVIYPAPGATATFNVLTSLTDGVTP